AIESYNQGDFQKSLQYFGEASELYPEKLTQLNYNMAQCLLQLNNKDSAIYHLQLVLGSPDPKLASKAANNLGVLQAEALQLNTALGSFKEALIFDPNNESARYNFELVRRQKQNNPPPENKPPDEDPPQEEEPPPPPPQMNDRELEKLVKQIRQRMTRSRGGSTDQARVLGDTLTEEEAFVILQSLENRDVQYVQQLKKIVRTSRKKRNKRPDW
ncbi:MAG: hypothetical protein AAF696_30520, partial [Bacteroidota bacterium]